MLAHIPGLRVVAPSTPERAYGLLLAAIRDPDADDAGALLAGG
jgi:2-oxoisovalerate dehydrogenase E1 component beta subunit